MEAGIVLADETFRGQLQSQCPGVYARCLERRAFMRQMLGIPVPEEVLPLSNIPGLVPPFFPSPNLVFALEP